MDRAIGAAERHRPLRPELLCGFFRPARIGGLGALDRLRLGSDDAPEHPSRLGHAPAYGMEADPEFVRAEADRLEGLRVVAVHPVAGVRLDDLPDTSEESALRAIVRIERRREAAFVRGRAVIDRA